MAAPKETVEKFNDTLNSYLDSIDSKFAVPDQDFKFRGWQVWLSSDCEKRGGHFLFDKIRGKDGTVLEQGGAGDHADNVEAYLKGELGPMVNYNGIIPFPKYIQSGVLQPVDEGWEHQADIWEFFESNSRPMDLRYVCVNNLYSNAQMDRPGYMFFADPWEWTENTKFPLSSLHYKLGTAGWGMALPQTQLSGTQKLILLKTSPPSMKLTRNTADR